ncbi:sphingoid base-phosphate phosphatase [Pyronema domesticum]|nr:sphingoid base-phosphate phosphatase [Pyronema domesticum]
MATTTAVADDTTQLCCADTEKGRSGVNVVDAGLLPRDHYKYRLPRWRYMLRQKLLVLVRLETPYLAWMQERCRTPFLDSYFALTANLGTHTFFMIMLPILFWFGYTTLARGVVHVLASGVFFSGFLKDLLCLPRPLSPPLHRITMSGSAALEYGFPSTHSTNAISVALYGLLVLYATPEVTAKQRILCESLALIYSFSIVFGRLYCGMHGFLDVIVGILLGALIAVLQWGFQDKIDEYVFGESFWPIAVCIITILVLVRIHPEPADACPCFDDGVAFAAVTAGVEIAGWHYSKTRFSWDYPVLGTVPYSYGDLGLVKSGLRVVIGILIVFLHRSLLKPLLHFILPPVFRIISRLGLSLPRKHFTPATSYKAVPQLPDDTLPGLNELPGLVRSIRRARSDSVGPQSVADAYETLAYREKRRRESVSKDGGVGGVNGMNGNGGNGNGAQGTNGIQRYENEMGTGGVDMDTLRNEAEEREVWRRVEVNRPRVRYDVEVVTKLVVYAGIAWWAVEGSPVIFEMVGLGCGERKVVA